MAVATPDAGSLASTSHHQAKGQRSQMWDGACQISRAGTREGREGRLSQGACKRTFRLSHRGLQAWQERNYGPGLVLRVGWVN